MASNYLEQVTPLFVSFCEAVGVYQAATQQLTDLGAIPALPVVVEEDSDYIDAVDARTEWVEDRAAAAALVTAALTNVRVIAFVLFTESPLAPNNWTELTAETPGDFAPFDDTVFIGYKPIPNMPDFAVLPYGSFEFASLIPYLVVLEEEPVVSFTEFISSNVAPGYPVAPATLPLSAMVLAAAVGATVEAPFTVNYTSGAQPYLWASLINTISVGASALDPSAWKVDHSEFSITFYPANDALLRTSGTKTLTIAASMFSNTVVSQAIAAGGPVQLLIVAQPTAPATNGAVLAVQPGLIIADQYGNRVASSTDDVTASVHTQSGAWTIGGTLTKRASAGQCSYTNITAGAAGAAAGRRIDFTCGSFPVVTSDPFNIPAP